MCRDAQELEMEGRKGASLLLVVLITSLVTFPGAAGASLIRATTCHDVDTSTREPLGEGSVFFTHASEVYVWVRLYGVLSGQTLRFLWISPGGVVIADNEVAGNPGYSGYWDSLPVQDALPEQDPGDWTVELYLDDVFKTALEFKLVSYDALVVENEYLLLIINSLSASLSDMNESYISILESIDSYTDEIATLSEDYTELHEEYASLLEGYDETQDALASLQAEYTTMSGNYESVSEDYDSLSEELASTQAALGTTRTMLYASGGRALVLLIASVYLINRGRRPPATAPKPLEGDGAPP